NEKEQDGKLAEKDKASEVKPQEVNGGNTLPSCSNGKTARVELDWAIPLLVNLPIEVLNHDQAFPFLNTTLADLGIDESAVKERVVLVDSKRTQVKGKKGKLREKEVNVLEVRVKAQHPGEAQSQEVIYSTESHTNRSFCRSGVDVRPWRHTDGEGGKQAGAGQQPVAVDAASEEGVKDLKAKGD
ncbi:hypothetical protein DNTS_012344, partial [Danionella cerebrum]